jgi:glycosyltransferase involved in cell wall biosynthesis
LAKLCRCNPINRQPLYHEENECSGRRHCSARRRVSVRSRTPPPRKLWAPRAQEWLGVFHQTTLLLAKIVGCDHLIKPEAKGRFQLFNINCDQLPQVVEHLKPVLRADAYRIIAPFWELSNLPDAWLPAIDLVDEVWAPTRFIQTTLVKKVRKPVLRMPLMLNFPRPHAANRDQLGLPDRAFLFFFAFDYFSFLERKNPLAVVSAFRRAFRSRGRPPAVRLVLKTMNADVVPESGRAMREMLQDDPDIILIEKTLKREDTLSLIAACDAVVTLHRSEGLGLLVAEAMVLGKPVIATDYSATTELVRPSTGWPVDYRLIPVQEGAYPFLRVRFGRMPISIMQRGRCSEWSTTDPKSNVWSQRPVR